MHLIVWYLKITNRAILSMTTDDCPKSGRVRAKSCLTGQCDWHLSVSNFKPEKGHVNKSFNKVYVFFNYVIIASIETKSKDSWSHDWIWVIPLSCFLYVHVYVFFLKQSGSVVVWQINNRDIEDSTPGGGGLNFFFLFCGSVFPSV